MQKVLQVQLTCKEDQETADALEWLGSGIMVPGAVLVAVALNLEACKVGLLVSCIVEPPNIVTLLQFTIRL